MGAGCCSSHLRAPRRLLRRAGSRSSRERGHRTLVAHPERHVSAELPSASPHSCAAGALIQVTADSSCARTDRPRDAGPSPKRASSTSSGATLTLPTVAARSVSGRRSRGSAPSKLSPRIEWMARRRRARSSRGDPLELPFCPRSSGVEARSSTLWRQLLDDAAGAAAEAMAEEVGGAGCGAGRSVCSHAGRRSGAAPGRPSSSRRSPRASRVRSAAAPTPRRRSSANDHRRLPGPGDDRRPGALLAQPLVAARIRAGVSTGPSMKAANSQSLILTRAGPPSRALSRRGEERSTRTGVPLRAYVGDEAAVDLQWQRLGRVGVADDQGVGVDGRRAGDREELVDLVSGGRHRRRSAPATPLAVAAVVDVGAAGLGGLDQAQLDRELLQQPPQTRCRPRRRRSRRGPARRRARRPSAPPRPPVRRRWTWMSSPPSAVSDSIVIESIGWGRRSRFGLVGHRARA